MGTSISGGKDSAKDKQIDALNAQARDCWIGTPRLRGLVPDDSRWERLNRSAAEFVERKNLGDLATCGVVNLFYYLLICDKLDAGVFLELPRKSIPLPREFCWAEEGIEEDVEIIDSFKTQQEGAYYPLVDFDPDQDPPNELATRKRRIARDDEEVVHVPELDRLSKMEVVSFNTYFAGVRKRVGKDSAALHLSLIHI